MGSLSIFLPAILIPLALSGAEALWLGKSRDLQNSSSWSRIPTSEDTALFTTPAELFLRDTLFTVGGFDYSENHSQNVPFTLQMEKSADLFFLGSGITNRAATTPTIRVTEESALHFRNNATIVGKVALVADGTGAIYFEDYATAGSAHIQGINAPNIHFLDHAGAGEAALLLKNSQLRFSDHASAENASITLDHSQLVFEEHSRSEKAKILAQSSKVTFYDHAQADRAALFLNNSALEIQADSAVGSLQADLLSQIGLNSYYLELGGNQKDSLIEGTISGTGGIVKVGSGALSFEGDNSYTGKTIIKEGSVKGEAAILPKTIVNDALLIFEQKKSQNFDGSISGNGQIAIRGRGSVNFLADNGAFSGYTLVDGSHLIVTNKLGGNVAVHPYGSLSGAGSILGNLSLLPHAALNNGQHALQIEGDYYQQKGSYLSLSTPEKIAVGGKALLEGGIVALNSNSLPTNQAIEILHAEGALTGTFEKAVSYNPRFVPSLSYEDNKAFLHLASDFAGSAYRTNQRTVARQIDSIKYQSPESQLLISSLASLPMDQFKDALDQLSGTQYANLLHLSAMTNRRFLRRIYDPFRPSAMDCCAAMNEGWLETWASWEGGNGFLKKDAQALGFAMVHTELSLGAHGYLFPCLAFGAAFNYEFSHLKFNQGGSGFANTIEGSLYAFYDNPWGYVLAIGTAGFSHWDIVQELDFDQFDVSAKSDPEIILLTLYGELGIDIYTKYILFQPFIAAEVGYYERDKVEQGGDIVNLAVLGHSWENFEGRLGVHSSTTFFCFTLGADLACQYRFTSLSNRVTNRFINFGQSFEVRGPNLGHSSLEGALFASMPFFSSSLLYARLWGEKMNRFGQYGLTVGLLTDW